MRSSDVIVRAVLAGTWGLAVLPAAAQPATAPAGSCTELAQAAPGGAAPADGRDTLHWRHTAKWSYQAYCRDMRSNPRTYFVLGPGNFFQYAPTGSGAKENWWRGTMVTSTYEMVEIDPVTMTVVQAPNDSFGRSDTGGIMTNEEKQFRSVPFGNVGECNDAVADMARGQIDLKQTNFRVSRDKSTLAMGGYRTSGGSIRFLDSGRMVEISSPQGYCAFVTGEVVLEPMPGL